MGPPRVSDSPGWSGSAVRSALREDEIGSPTWAREDHVVFDPPAAGFPAGWEGDPNHHLAGAGLPAADRSPWSLDAVHATGVGAPTGVCRLINS